MSQLRNLNRRLISNIKNHELTTSTKRNLILSILKSTTTKREARNYLQKYQNQFDFNNSDASTGKTDADAQRELLVDRFLSGKSLGRPVYDKASQKVERIPLRLAIFNFKQQSILPLLWKGIRETFKRLLNLGVSPVIVLDFDHIQNDSFKYNELYMMNQLNRVMNALEKPNDGAIQTMPLWSIFSTNDAMRSFHVESLEHILVPLYQGVIPIVMPLAYDTVSTKQRFAPAQAISYFLLESLLSLAPSALSIEKIVFIDPLGGIPSIERNQTSHVFINLSQEYSDIVSELFIGFIEPEQRELHLQNLSYMNKLLTMIHSKCGSDDATGIITTPHIMSINDDQLNPIIYNILTDRSIISSSLPLSRVATPELSTSVLKKGVDVAMYDASNFSGLFTFSNLERSNFVDKKRLVLLLEDSFGKTLDTEAYFRRIDNSLATLVIAGDYDGAAIITWEEPKGSGSKIAYLDKFAIAKRNQGLPGLADVIFKVILQSHSGELIWRSQKRNPVNKWYFERSRGLVSSQNSPWRVFYTGTIFDKRINKSRNGEDLDISKKIHEYIDIGEGIPASFVSR